MHINMEQNAEADPSGGNFSVELIISSISLVTLASLLAVCICCKRRNQKSELAGVEGIVKLKQLDDGSTINVSIDTTDSADALSPKTKLAHHQQLLQKNATLPFDAKLGNGNGFQDNELKRSSTNAPHRSLPDIPIVETVVCDNNSELYATVGDKLQDAKIASEKSPANPKKLANISQHSSMSQADDSSPYARVRSPQHAYDKLKKTEHPYAQVIQIQPAANGVAQVVLENDDDDDDDDEDEEDETTIENPISHRESSNNDLLSTAESHLDASAAISGRISASQELPYMTPPIVASSMTSSSHAPQQHFSGDSQDSSKGYTSISVREPLANILAQTNQQNAQRCRREIQDSHNNFYATVSDDSDEMYAAIEDPNNVNGGGDLYTSGSETYAQIQAPMTVSVEINQQPSQQQQQQQQSSQQTDSSHRSSTRPISSHHEGDVSQIEVLKNIHSRQASSSSCTSSVGNNIGSPKPEKRQANSPLPPTPQAQNKAKDSNNNSSSKTRQEVEGMYAKVMKKSKLSSVAFENASPVLVNRHEIDVTDGGGVTEIKIVTGGGGGGGNEYETIDKKRHRSSRNSDHLIGYSGYETIPADRNNNKESESITATPAVPHYAQIEEKNKKREDALSGSDNHPKYETLKPTPKTAAAAADSITTDSDYDPNYEIVLSKNQQRISSSSSTSSTLVDDGYTQIGKRLNHISDDDESIPGYSTIKKVENDYSSIGDKLRASDDAENDTDSNLYSSIPAVALPASQTVITPSTDSYSSDLHLDYEQITSTSVTPTTANNNYELLSMSESSINESSARVLPHKENPYERLHNEKSPDVETMGNGKQQQEGRVDDFFKV